MIMTSCSLSGVSFSGVWVLPEHPLTSDGKNWYLRLQNDRRKCQETYAKSYAYTVIKFHATI